MTGRTLHIEPTYCPKKHVFPYPIEEVPTMCPTPGCGSRGPFTREMKLRG